jgi:hypothetical protein
MCKLEHKELGMLGISPDQHPVTLVHKTAPLLSGHLWTCLYYFVKGLWFGVVCIR